MIATSLLVVAGALPAAAAADRPPVGAWSGPARYATAASAKGLDTAGASPRVAINADGTSGMVFRTITRHPELRLVAKRSTGRFGAARTVTRRFASSYSVAATGRGVVTTVWLDRDGVHAAQLRGDRLRRQLVVPGPRSGIDDVQLVRSRQGGYLAVMTRFAAGRTTVSTQDLDATAAPVGPLIDLGSGAFGGGARERVNAVVDPAGVAYLAYEVAPTPPATQAQTLVRVRPPGGAWSAGTLLPAVDARLSVGETGALLAGTAPARASEVATFGLPTVVPIAADGTTGAALTPTGVVPTSAFQPSAAALLPTGALVLFSQRSVPKAFSVTAPVLARRLDASGRTVGTQELTASADAAEPFLVSVPATGQALAIWSGPRGWGTALTDEQGRLHAVRPPAGPPPTPYHLNPTNRDVRAGGRYVAVAWQRDARVSVSVLRAG